MAPSDACAAGAQWLLKKVNNARSVVLSLLTISAVLKITRPTLPTEHLSCARVPTASGSVHARTNRIISWLEGTAIDTRKNAVDVALRSSFCVFQNPPLRVCRAARGFFITAQAFIEGAYSLVIAIFVARRRVNTSHSHRLSKNPWLKLENQSLQGLLLENDSLNKNGRI